MNNISNLNNGSKNQPNQQQQRNSATSSSSSKKGQNPQPLAITYVDKAPKPRNPDRSRCSSVCTNWKNSLRNDKPERLFPAIPNPNARSNSVQARTRRPSDSTNNQRFSRYSNIRSRTSSDHPGYLNRSYPGAMHNRNNKLRQPQDDEESTASSGSPAEGGGSGSSSHLEVDRGGPYQCDDPEEEKLVTVLEREMLSRHPNVPWTEIAGLHEAKALLQEAVILPILMPDYFQGIRRPLKGTDSDLKQLYQKKQLFLRVFRVSVLCLKKTNFIPIFFITTFLSF